jgi:hypothetical protein
MRLVCLEARLKRRTMIELALSQGSSGSHFLLNFLRGLSLQVLQRGVRHRSVAFEAGA